jgi:hypothetical protein
MIPVAVLGMTVLNVHAETSSARLVAELGNAMTARHLEAYAAKVPQTNNEYVAALLYPYVQLLVVGARYPTPAALDPLIAQQQYHNVYTALQGTPLRDSILLVQDIGVDGLRVDATQTADLIYQAWHQTVLNGDVKALEYQREIDSIDPAYSRLLQVLLDALRSDSSLAAR